MADTIADIEAPSGDWIDLYSESAIPIGISLLITNKSSYEVLLQVSQTKPSLNSKYGEPLRISGPHSRLVVESGASGVWAKSLDNDDPALISVQELR